MAGKLGGRLAAQLGLLLRLARVSPGRWVASTVVVSVLLAALDTLGVAAMIPLMQIATGGPLDTGAAGVIAGILGTDSPQTLLVVTAGFVTVVFIAKSVGAIFFRWWLLGRTSRITALVSTEMLRRYALEPYGEHRRRRLSEIYRNVNDATNQAASVLLAVVSLVSDILVLVAIVGVLAWASPSVTLFTIVLFTVLVLGVQRALQRRQRRVGEESAEAGLEAWQALMPALDGFREARLASSSSMFIGRFEAARLRAARANQQMGLLGEAPRHILEIGFVLAIMGISAILFTTMTPQSAFTILGVFAAASVRALPTMTRVNANLAVIRIGGVGLDILEEAVAELDGGPIHQETPVSATAPQGDITLDHVSFRYPGSTELVLDDISLTIRANRTTAFVGSSGAGKSTLLDLVLALLEPTDGSIECGGAPILDDRAAWYRNLGVVPQDVFLVNDSVRANIAFGVALSDIDDDRIAEVARMARLSELIDQLPEGIETMVGERGLRLSGGQRQRLGIARALYRHPKLLVLDEATSALDNLTEHEIAETLASLRGSMTIIIVAHRLSTVRHADKLVFLKDGRIEAHGTFTEVRERSADFARLVTLGELN